MASQSLSGGWLGRDLRFAWRMAFKHPLFSATIILSLTLGIGANTAIFSLLHATLFRSLPVERPEELVILSEPGSSGSMTGTDDGRRALFSYSEFEYLKESSDAFSGLMASQSSSSGVAVRGIRRGRGEGPSANGLRQLLFGLGGWPIAGQDLQRTKPPGALGSPQLPLLATALRARGRSSSAKRSAQRPTCGCRSKPSSFCCRASVSE